MSSLIVILPAETPGPATHYSYVLAADGRTPVSHGHVPAALLPQSAQVTEVVALVPARALSWHLLQLPRGTLGKGWFNDGTTPRLRAVLEGLLEERLLDEPAHLHFALAPDARAGAPVWVAVCDRAWLGAALQALEQSGRTVSRIVPEFVPEAQPPTLHVIGDGPMAQVVSSDRNGVTVLPLSGASVTFTNWPADAEIVAEPGVAALAEQLFQRQATLQLDAERWLRAAESSWDLAQFELVNTSSSRTWKRLATGWRAMLHARRWRPARWAALVLALTQLIGLNAWAWKEQSAIAGKREALSRILTSTFPSVKVVVYPQQQMENELAALRLSTGAASGRDLESLMASLGLAVPAGKTLTAVDFVTGELRAKGLSLTPIEQSQILAQFQARGVSARMDGDTLVIKTEGKP